MSHPYERPPVPIANLTAEDHVLLAHIADEQFALRHVVGNSIHLHPAQQTLLTLTQWLKLPHIAAAARELQADLREYESVRLEFLQRHSIDGLVDAMHSASRNLKLLEESRTHNIQHTRAVEELRLAAQALNRATKPGATAPSVPSPDGSAPGGTGLPTGVPSASRPTDPLGGQCESASSSPRSGASHEPGASAPEKETSLTTLPSSSPSTEGAPHTADSHSATAPLCHSATFSSLPSTPSPSPAGCMMVAGGADCAAVQRPEDSPSISTRSPDAQTCDITLPDARCPVPGASASHSVTSSSDSTPRHLDTTTPSSVRARDRP